MEKQQVKIKNPLIKLSVYALLTMAIGIGAAWLLLGIISPVLLVLLIKHW